MAVAETAKLIASLELKDLFSKSVNDATKSLGKLDKSLTGTQSRAYKAGAQIGTGIKRSLALVTAGVGILATQVAFGVKSLEGLEQVTAQTNAVLKSTHGVAGQTADGIRNMSNAFESLNATMDDTSIQAGANVLLTFTNITKKAFKPALQAALDLSTALRQDLQSSVVRIGKALNDPIKGITALTRIGVRFTAQQKEQIKALAGAGDEAVKLGVKITANKQKLAELVAEGKGSSKAADTLRTKIALQGEAYVAFNKKAKDTSGTLKAQQIILAELSREFGGSFLAQGNTTAGKIAKVKDAIDDLQRALATALLPALGKIADAMRKFLTDPQVVAQVKKLGESIAGLFSDENLAKGADFLRGMFETAKELAPVLEASAKATFTLVQAAVSLFKSLPPEIQGLVAGAFAINKLTGGLVTNIGGALIDLVGKSRGATPANPVFVSDVSAGIGGAAGAVAGKGGGVTGLFASAFKVFSATVIAASIIEASVPIGKAFASALPDWLKGPGGQGESEAQRRRREADAAMAPRTPLVQTLLDRGGRETGIAGSLQGKLRDDKLAGSLVELRKGITAAFKSAIDTLRHSTDPARLLNAVKTLREVMVANGHGSVQQTKDTIHVLEAQLKKTHDPTLEKAIRGAITDLRNKIPGREYAQKALNKADKIIHGTEPLAQKIKELQAIERDLKDHKLPGQTQTLSRKIDAMRAQLAHTTSATTQAVKDKDLSLKLNVYNPVRVNINARQVAATNAIFSKYFGGTPTGTRAPRGG